MIPNSSPCPTFVPGHRGALSPTTVPAMRLDALLLTNATAGSVAAVAAAQVAAGVALCCTTTSQVSDILVPRDRYFSTTYIYMYTYMYVYVRICTHKHTHTHTHTHTHKEGQ